MEGISADLREGLSVTLNTFTGGVDFTAVESPAQEVLRRGISALHEAIGSGVATRTFCASEDVRRTRDFNLMHELASALRNEEGLYLAYQPKICLKSGAPVGLEALIRWRHPQLGELSPSAFVPLAEQTELLSELNAWVIDRVIARLARLRNHCIQLPISVNVSLNDFARQGFADTLEDKMLKVRLPNALLGVECLETERLIESPAAMRGLEMLELRGFGISLDDFGTGYSNISYLRRMPLDVIKLDRSLISGLASDTASRIIARNIITMLKELDYVVLAEGIECGDVASMLCEYGCDQAQGYFYAKPLPDRELDAWLDWRLRNKCS